MQGFRKKLKSDGTYHAPGKGDQSQLELYSDDDVSEWANDQACIDRDKCLNELVRRSKVRADQEEIRINREALAESQRLAEEVRLSKRRALLEAVPFDSRTEISADARHIAGRVVTALWIIFVLIPFVLGILFEILK